MSTSDCPAKPVGTSTFVRQTAQSLYDSSVDWIDIRDDLLRKVLGDLPQTSESALHVSKRMFLAARAWNSAARAAYFTHVLMATLDSAANARLPAATSNPDESTRMFVAWMWTIHNSAAAEQLNRATKDPLLRPLLSAMSNAHRLRDIALRAYQADAPHPATPQSTAPQSKYLRHRSTLLPSQFWQLAHIVRETATHLSDDIAADPTTRARWLLQNREQVLAPLRANTSTFVQMFPSDASPGLHSSGFKLGLRMCQSDDGTPDWTHSGLKSGWRVANLCPASTAVRIALNSDHRGTLAAATRPFNDELGVTVPIDNACSGELLLYSSTPTAGRTLLLH